MIKTVNYRKANMLSLPYNDKEGNVKFLELMPGRNDVGGEILDAIQKHLSEDKWDHYMRHIDIEEIVQEDGSEDYSSLNARDFIELIKGTMDTDKLALYSDHEIVQTKPRKSVLDAINDQNEKLNTPTD
ncbi:hypothetical protein KAR91_07960 [Candidatus Pacearchaeota archaeon]|nr:hypothetical protein [Candidatus Pacearchaeota archaeon]